MLRELEREYKRYGKLTNPALWTMAVYHYGNWSLTFRSKLLRTASSRVYGGLYLAIELATGNTINREARIGRDLHLVH